MPIYSHSKLEAFENCPRRYWYAYIGKPEIEKVESVEAFLGKRVHETMEELYRLKQGGRVLTEEETVRWFETAWERNWSEDVRVVSRRLAPEDYRRVGLDSVAAYHRRHRPFDQSKTLGLEKRVLLDLDPGGTRKMQGYVDRIARRSDGTYEIHDYKTSAHLPTQEQADRDRQLALYQIGLQGMWADVRDVDLVWHYVRFDTDIVSRRSDEQLREVREACIVTIEDIEARGREEDAFPTNPTRLCDWCDYQAICPATRHAASTEALPAEEFKQDDGVRLVDAWADVSARRKALDAEVKVLKEEEQELQERLAAFAEQEGLEVVVGSTHAAKVTSVVEVTVPPTDSELRAAFEVALKETEIWDRVATPNHQRMVSILRDAGSLPPEADEMLRPFVERTVVPKVSLRKRKDHSEEAE